MKNLNFLHSDYIIKIFFFYIMLTLFLHFEAKGIGYVESIQGEAQINIDNEDLPLQELDEVFLNNKIKIPDKSELTILLDDGSTIIVKNKSEIIFIEYEDIFSINPHYTIQVFEGELIVETGELPKFKKNSTSIISPIGELFLNGTAVSAKLYGDSSEVFLMTDSFGESGELILQDENGDSMNIEINSGLAINDNGVNKVELTEEVINNQNNIKKVIADGKTLVFS